MKRVYYRSEGKSVCADVIPFFEDGAFRLFYLRDYRDREEHGEGCPWCLLETSNFQDYKDHGPVLLRGTEEDQDLYVFTGSIIKKDDTYHIYYTGHNPHLRAQGFPEQKILRASSKDLVTWTKDKGFVFEAPDYLEMHDFRDPFVFYDDEDKVYKMLIAARDKNDVDPYFVKGVTLVATSKDLDKWELQKEPFYAPHAYFTHECPDLFKMGDWWYLLFSEFTDKISTTYRMSKSPKGPWFAPKNNTFDGHAFYAAKSYSDGKRRILFGWNCIKNFENDFDFWQWGGNIIPHEIVQNKDGTLAVKCPDEIKNAFDKEYLTKERLTVGGVRKENNKYFVGDDGLNIQTFGDIPTVCKVEFSFKMQDDRGDFGLIVHGQENLANHYKIKFEPRHNRLAMDMTPRRDGALHCEVDTERYIELKPGELNKVVVIMQESVLEVYVNDKVAMSGRMFNFKDGELGIYTNNTTVEFSDITVKE